MRIAVIGCGRDEETSLDVSKRAYLIGEQIARLKHEIITGGCRGYPYDAAKGVISSGGKAVSYSPAKDLSEHEKKYGFPCDGQEIVFTGKGIPQRNIDVVQNADAVIMVGGELGTLNEFIFSVYFNKKVGILKGSGGISEMIPAIMKICPRYEKRSRIFIEEDPAAIVRRVSS